MSTSVERTDGSRTAISATTFFSIFSLLIGAATCNGSEILNAARASYRSNQAKLTFSVAKKVDWFPGSSLFDSSGSDVNSKFTQIGTGHPLDLTRPITFAGLAQAGDVVEITIHTKTGASSILPLVYAGKEKFSDRTDDYDFFIYPFNWGLEYNTFPPRKNQRYLLWHESKGLKGLSKICSYSRDEAHDADWIDKGPDAITKSPIVHLNAKSASAKIYRPSEMIAKNSTGDKPTPTPSGANAGKKPTPNPSGPPLWPSNLMVGSNGSEVALLQSLLSELLDEKLTVDGDFGLGTKKAVLKFQSANSLASSGDVDRATWEKLFQKAIRYKITFKRGNEIADNPKTREREDMYECVVEVQRIGLKGIEAVKSFRGSVIPDDLKTRGRVTDGWYRLKLGFHSRSKEQATVDPKTNKTIVTRVPLFPKQADVVVKSSGTLRPCLVVNEDNPVPVVSDNPEKRTSGSIHIHNGFTHDGVKFARFSDGCPTIFPSNWADFIKQFLDDYNQLDDWDKNSTYRGRDIGVLVIEPPAASSEDR